MNTIIDFLNQDLFQGFVFVEKDGKIWVLMDDNPKKPIGFVANQAVRFFVKTEKSVMDRINNVVDKALDAIYLQNLKN